MSEGVQSVQIREVWDDDLEAEFALIREIVDSYMHVAIDTEFPGLVLRPAIGIRKTASENKYKSLKDNVDSFMLIRMGLTMSNEAGGLPTCGPDRKYCAWQFNFRVDASSTDWIKDLRLSCIDLEKNSRDGIDGSRFGELVMSSGLVLNADMKWVASHGGYDFGSPLKLLTGKSSLPDTEAEFLQLIDIFFGNVYDVKHMVMSCKGLDGGLNKVAKLLDVERVGFYEHAGSNSLLTYGIFNKLKESYFKGYTVKYAGVLYGLGSEVKMTRVTTLPTEM